MSLPIKVKKYLAIIYIITAVSIGLIISTNYIEIRNVDAISVLFFAVLMALTETFTVSYKNISFSTSFSLTIASFLLFGPIATIVVNIIGFSLRVIKVNNRYKHFFNTPFYGTLSNYCILTLPMIYAYYTYTFTTNLFLNNELLVKIVPIICFSLVFFIINTLIISIQFSVISGKQFLYSFIANIKLGMLNIIAMAPFGVILAVVFNNYGYIGILLLFSPIVLARYTFSLYIDSKSKYVQTVDALMRAMEARDKYTEGHSQRVANLASSIAKELGYNEWKIEHLNIASLLHDVGKIGIDDSILNKPGKLTNEEFEVIKKHPEIGYNILKDINGLENIVSIARYHHERYDGKGYPCGKSADELDFDVFIVQLADAVDAMTTDRPYRKALSEDEILNEVKKHSGTQFHPKVVEAYLRMAEKQKKVV